MEDTITNHVEAWWRSIIHQSPSVPADDGECSRAIASSTVSRCCHECLESTWTNGLRAAMAAMLSTGLYSNET